MTEFFDDLIKARESGFYRRAQAICNGEPDPLQEQERKEQEQRDQSA